MSEEFQHPLEDFLFKYRTGNSERVKERHTFGGKVKRKYNEMGERGVRSGTNLPEGKESMNGEHPSWADQGGEITRREKKSRGNRKAYRVLANNEGRAKRLPMQYQPKSWGKPKIWAEGEDCRGKIQDVTHNTSSVSNAKTSAGDKREGRARTFKSRSCLEAKSCWERGAITKFTNFRDKRENVRMGVMMRTLFRDRGSPKPDTKKEGGGGLDSCPNMKWRSRGGTDFLTGRRRAPFQQSVSGHGL